MGQRIAVLSCVLVCVSFTESHDVRILQPKARLVLGGFTGATVPFQAFIERHPDHRLVQLEVWEGELRIQMSNWGIDGESAKMQPTVKPLLVHLSPGRFTFRALACSSVTEQNECGKVRASASQELRVCGGEEGC